MNAFKHGITLAVLFIHLSLVLSIPLELNTKPVPTSSDDKGIADVIDNIVNLGQTVKCATGQGQAGRCTVGSCPNLGNHTSVACLGKTRLFKCCPNEVAKEVFPQKIEGCGIRPPRTGNLIVGGTEAIPHSWPWATALYRINGNREFFQCGGSIISEQYILTAAHCVSRPLENLTAKDFIVKVGAHDLGNSGEFIELESVIVHENYSPQYHNDDIALLKLKRPLVFEKDGDIGPVCLPPNGTNIGRNVGTIATMVGWGLHDQVDLYPSSTLYQVEVPVSDPRKCKNAYTALIGFNSYFNWNNVICASYQNGGKDTCQGDSGGPMTIPSGNVYSQVGVVSFGYGCAQKGYPGVYTYVPHYLNWIGAHMQ